MSSTRFSTTASGKVTIEKDPDAVLDYVFLWQDWLAVGEEIQSHSTVVEGASSGYVQSAFIHQGDAVIAFVAGGAIGETIALRCRVFTTAGRLDDRTIYIKVKAF